MLSTWNKPEAENTAFVMVVAGFHDTNLETGTQSNPAMSKLRLTSLVLAVFLAQTALAAKDYYMWVDENGVTNFSSQRPKDHPEAKHIVEGEGSAENLENSRRPGHETPTRESEPAPAPQPAAKPASKQTVDPDKVAAAERAKLEQKVEAEKRANCEKARKNLAMLQRHPRIRTTGPNGEERVMSPQEKQAKIEASQTAIRDNCSP